MSYAFSNGYSDAQAYKDEFLKFTGKFVQLSSDMSYFIIQNPENEFDKTEYKIYLNGSEIFKQRISSLDINQNVVVYVRCRAVNRFKGYELDLKDIEENIG